MAQALAVRTQPHRWPAELRKAFYASLIERHYRDSRFLVMLGVMVVAAVIPATFYMMPDHIGRMAMMLGLVVLPLQVIALVTPIRLIALQKLAMMLSIIAFASVLLIGAHGHRP